jgi:dTDP-D-glucose 4,6-dehydratase
LLPAQPDSSVFTSAGACWHGGDAVLGLDNLNSYYDVSLKQARLAQLQPHPGFSFVQADLADRPAMEQLFSVEQFDIVIHLAAQPVSDTRLRTPMPMLTAT